MATVGGRALVVLLLALTSVVTADDREELGIRECRERDNVDGAEVSPPTRIEGEVLDLRWPPVMDLNATVRVYLCPEDFDAANAPRRDECLVKIPLLLGDPKHYLYKADWSSLKEPFEGILTVHIPEDFTCQSCSIQLQFLMALADELQKIVFCVDVIITEAKEPKKRIFSGLTNVLDHIGGAAKNVLDGAVENVGGAVEDIVGTVKDAVGDVVEDIGGAVDDIVDTVKDVGGAVIQAGRGAVKGILKTYLPPPPPQPGYYSYYPAYPVLAYPPQAPPPPSAYPPQGPGNQVPRQYLPGYLPQFPKAPNSPSDANRNDITHIE